MTIGDKIRNKKIQYDINREAANISALSSGKIDKYEYITEIGILHSNQRQIIEQVQFAYSLLGKTFEKQTEKQVGALESLDRSNKKKLKQIVGIFTKNFMNDQIHVRVK